MNDRKTAYHHNYYEYNDEWIEVNQGDSGLYKQIMDRMIHQIDTAIAIHKRVLVYRFDLHVKHYECDNIKITVFIKRLKAYLLKHYQMKQVGHFWVREKERAKQQHYHCFLVLDGNKMQHPKKIEQVMKSMWLENGHMPYLEHPFYYIDKNNIEAERLKVIYRVSYLAKVRGKGYRDKQAKDCSGSRLHMVQ